MAKVTGLTAARMLQIENASVVGGRIENDELILTTYGGTEINTGVVKGEQGNSGETSAVLKIDSSRGLVFKNNLVSTILTVTVFYGSQAITNQTALREIYGPSAYLEWQVRRLSDENFSVLISTDPRISNEGFTLSVSPSDVDTKVVFRCVLKGD